MALFACSWLTQLPAHAHPLSPASVVLIEHAEAGAVAGKPGQHSTFRVRFRRAEQAAGQLVLELPEFCARDTASAQRIGDQLEDTFTLTCSRALFGERVGVRGLSELGLSAVVYAEYRTGERVRGLLTADATSFALPHEVSKLAVFFDYLRLGMEHLFMGADHLLFVLGLFFLAQSLRALVWTLSAFTLGHSLTLCLLALSIVQVHAPLVELSIALSLLALAVSLVRSVPSPHRPLRVATSDREETRTRSVAWPAVAMVLGLLHGLGFAGALSETGLPEHQIPLSLLGFNLGIECAQLLLVLCAFAFVRLFPLLKRGRARFFVAYVIGAWSAMWCIERTLSMLS